MVVTEARSMVEHRRRVTDVATWQESARADDASAPMRGIIVEIVDVGRDSPPPRDARVRDHLPQLHVADVVGTLVADPLWDA
jgi:hypothetical protein